MNELFELQVAIDMEVWMFMKELEVI